MKDPEFRYQIANRAGRTPENQALMMHVSRVGNHCESLGMLVTWLSWGRESALPPLRFFATLSQPFEVAPYFRVGPTAVVDNRSQGIKYTGK
jgi:hypothetical protein